MPYGSTFTDKEFYITTEPLSMFAGELMEDIEDYFNMRSSRVPLDSHVQHDAVYVLNDAYYPIFDEGSLLSESVFYDEDFQFVDSRLKPDIISKKVTSYRVIDMAQKISVIQLDRIKDADDLFVHSLLEEGHNWKLRELSSLHLIISLVKHCVIG